MTRKDYIAMAEHFKAALQERRARVMAVKDDAIYTSALNYQCIGFVDAIHVAANVFAADNPMFDRAKFLAACGVAS